MCDALERIAVLDETQRPQRVARARVGDVADRMDVVRVCIGKVDMSASGQKDFAIVNLEHVDAGDAGVAGRSLEGKHLGLVARLRQFEIVRSVAGGETGARDLTAEAAGAAAGVAGCPVDVLITVGDIEIAVAEADQLELKCIKLVFVGIVIAHIIPGDGQHAIGCVEVIIDAVRAG
jgi:hypothetical protein